MTNAFGVLLDSSAVRRAAVEDVSETVIAAIYLLPERSVADIVAKLRPGELEHVVKLVGRCPSCYPPGTLDNLKGRRQSRSPDHVASTSTSVASGQPAAEDARRAQERRLARIRVQATQSATERVAVWSHRRQRRSLSSVTSNVTRPGAFSTTSFGVGA
jgi:hypothetical protein